MIEYIIGGAVLLVGVLGKALSGSSNDTASSVGEKMESFKDDTIDKISEAKSKAEGMSDKQLESAIRHGSGINAAAARSEYKKRHQDE